MSISRIGLRVGLAFLLCVGGLLYHRIIQAADHNDPNAVNSIFSDIAIQPADLYGMFGYPSDDKTNGEKVVLQLTFASIPQTGIFDQDMLYTLNIDPDPRIATTMKGNSFEDVLRYTSAIKDKYFKQEAYQIKVTFNESNQAQLNFGDFPGGSFATVVNTNQVLKLKSPQGHEIKAFIGGRDDPFFNDLPGFFRSINYGPQFYDIPVTMADEYREFPIPKTLLELEGNHLFNFDPNRPRHGSGVKLNLPQGPYTWSGDRFLKDAAGNYRFVYSGKDAQAGFNVNAIVFEIPMAYLTEEPEEDRIVRVWGESWVLRASGKVKHAPERKPSLWARVKAWFSDMMDDSDFNDNLVDYKLVDHVGVPFSDAGLSLRSDEKVGANNIKYGRDFVRRLAHLGWGFGPSIKALGLGTCFDCDDVEVSQHKFHKLATTAFPRAKKCLFQKLNMPDDSWNTSGQDIPLKSSFEIFVPNVTNIDMDTNGTWPYGRRLEDQVATRFLSVFLDMESGCGGEPCSIETLNDQALWDGAAITPKTPPNPLRNDKPFLDYFPYLAEPWPRMTAK